MTEQITPMDSAIKILNTMATHYAIQAERAGMDFGGVYEYEIFKEREKLAINLRNQLEEIGASYIEELPARVQIFNVNRIPVNIDFDHFGAILSDYYDLQDSYYKQAKTNMNMAKTILRYVQTAEKCRGDDNE